MSDQRTSLHVIVFLGLACLGLMMIFMMMSLEGLEQSSAGSRARLANALQQKQGKAFEDFVVEWKDGSGFKILQVSYTTRTYQKLQPRQEEMRTIAQFLRDESSKYEDAEFTEMRQIAVKRTFLCGSGCFQSREESSFTLDVPPRPPKEKPKERPVPTRNH